ncbi:S1 family peptidase [Nocardioides ginsengisegetis]|uniref:trypsin-like peptidase domain-containing protein n=1 Tax=Nocardioides ginsengisegetis TaxID=661491 RepID=UPI0015FADB91
MRRLPTSRWTATACLLLTALLAGCSEQDSWPERRTDAFDSPGAVQTSGDNLGGTLAGEILSQTDWTRTINAVKPATFEVFNHGCSFEATGSAVVLSPTTLVTNRHVVAGARTMAVRAPQGAMTRVDSWVVSRRDDLALLHLASPITSAPVSLSTDPTPGDLVAALGYPLGGPLRTAQGRVVGVGDVPGVSGAMITASMDILPGNSGGPLVNTEGELVGLIRAIDLVDGWAIAVPVDRVARLLNHEYSTPGIPCRP